MTISIIIQIISIVMLMLLAVPGTQLLWKFGNKETGELRNSGIRKFAGLEMVKSEKKSGVKEIRKPEWVSELSKIAAAIF